jgi:hypothetical protein
MDRNDDFVHRFADFDQLRGAGLRMGFQFAALGPFVDLVMVIDVAEQQA